MAATTNLMADVEGVDMQDDPENIKNDFNYHNNVNGATKHIRLGFLRKVYSLLGIQLILTTVIAAACMFTPQIKGFVHENPWMLLLAFVSSMGLLMALHIKRRESPVNLILLAAFVSLRTHFWWYFGCENICVFRLWLRPLQLASSCPFTIPMWSCKPSFWRLLWSLDWLYSHSKPKRTSPDGEQGNECVSLFTNNR